ncbi:MAG: cyclic nucleotide-binding domain-containing protein, partial [Myxococcota bacterium]
RDSGQRGQPQQCAGQRAARPRRGGPPMTGAANTLTCDSCPVGTISGHGQGNFCPYLVRDYPAGTTLFRSGQTADYVWLVKSGTIALSQHDQVCAVRGPGLFVGIDGLAEGRYRYTARVRTPTTLCGASRDGFEQWLISRSKQVCAAICRSPIRMSYPRPGRYTASEGPGHAQTDHLSRIGSSR